MSGSLSVEPWTGRRLAAWPLALTAGAVAVVLLLLVYASTSWSLLWTWAHDGTYQYAFLIFPLAIWVAWGLRHRLQARAPAPSAWGLVAMAALALGWYVGEMLGINLARHLALVAMFPALVLALWGWRALRVLIFPLAYVVVFAVPWGNGMVGSLQDVTAHIAVHALNLTGTPVLLNGREIITPSAVWLVAEACSGVKFFFACLALGCLYAYLMYTRWPKRVLFVLLAAVVPILANGLRVYCTILIGETWGLHYATGTDHLVFGWQFFGTVLVLLLLAGWFFRDPLPGQQRPPRAHARLARRARVVWPLAAALLVAGPALALTLTPPADVTRLTLQAPTLPHWDGPTPADAAWRPTFQGAAGQFHAQYHSGAAQVGLYHAVYTGRPRAQHSLITFGNNVYDPAREHVLETATIAADAAAGHAWPVRELRLAGANGPRLVWYWYCVASRCTTAPVTVKLLQAWHALGSHNTRSSIWALSVPVRHGDRARARAQLRRFTRDLAQAPMAAGARR